jgi:hypothetical protein
VADCSWTGRRAGYAGYRGHAGGGQRPRWWCKIHPNANTVGVCARWLRDRILALVVKRTEVAVMVLTARPDRTECPCAWPRRGGMRDAEVVFSV